MPAITEEELFQHLYKAIQRRGFWLIIPGGYDITGTFKGSGCDVRCTCPASIFRQGLCKHMGEYAQAIKDARRHLPVTDSRVTQVF